jgi:rhodanese-related sulfurtransferase
MNLQRAHLLSFAVLALTALTACSQGGTQQPKAGTATETTTQAPETLDAKSFQAAIGEGKALLVDVRTPAEYAGGHLEGSLNVDWTGANHEAEFAKLPKDQPLLLYCRSGGRSGQAMDYLKSKGYQVQHLGGGIGAWMSAGLPVTQ